MVTKFGLCTWLDEGVSTRSADVQIPVFQLTLNESISATRRARKMRFWMPKSELFGESDEMNLGTVILYTINTTH